MYKDKKNKPRGFFENCLKKTACFFILSYQVFFRSFFSTGACRFFPTCSSYVLKAFQKKSFFCALFLALRRILRCHPLSRGGYDPLAVKEKN